MSEPANDRPLQHHDFAFCARCGAVAQSWADGPMGVAEGRCAEHAESAALLVPSNSSAALTSSPFVDDPLVEAGRAATAEALAVKDGPGMFAWAQRNSSSALAGSQQCIVNAPLHGGAVGPCMEALGHVGPHRFLARPVYIEDDDLPPIRVGAVSEAELHNAGLADRIAASLRVRVEDRKSSGGPCPEERFTPRDKTMTRRRW